MTTGPAAPILPSFSFNSSISLLACLPFKKTMNATLQRMNTPWKIRARRMLSGGLAVEDARRAPLAKTYMMPNRLPLNAGTKIDELNEGMHVWHVLKGTYENHSTAELPSAFRVSSAASSRATGRRVKLVAPMIANRAYNAPTFPGLTGRQTKHNPWSVMLSPETRKP